MNEQDFERLVREAASRSRVPDPPLDRMWSRIESRVFAPRVLPFGRQWLRPLAYAATLVAGIGIGYAGSGVRRADSPAAPAVAAGPPAEPSPFVGVASDYLEQATALMVTVAGTDSVATLTAGTVHRARELLSTTRLLLDAGVESPGLRDLLQDMELVLAQLVRLPDSPPPQDARFVTDAVTQRDVLPRLTLYLADARGTP
jgi:hypothetical protein